MSLEHLNPPQIGVSRVWLGGNMADRSNSACKHRRSIGLHVMRLNESTHIHCVRSRNVKIRQDDSLIRETHETT